MALTSRTGGSEEEEEDEGEDKIDDDDDTIDLSASPSACLTSDVCAGPLGAVSDADAPPWLTAEPSKRASIAEAGGRLLDAAAAAGEKPASS